MAGKFFNPYAGNYSATSQAVGSAVQGVVDERRAQEEAKRREEQHLAEQERIAVATENQQLQLADRKAAQYESLNVAADTGIKSADQYIMGASRGLVDKQAANVAALKNGEIDTDQFAQQAAIIKQQIPALQQTKKALTDWQSEYETLLDTGEISKADDGQSTRLYQAVKDGTLEIIPDESGQMIMKTRDDAMVEGEEPIHMPLSQISRLPKPTKLGADPAELAKGPLATIGDGEWGPLAEEEIHKSIDNLFTGDTVKDEKTLTSIAVDRLQIPLARAQEMLNTPLDVATSGGATNELEAEVESSIFNAVKTQYDAKKLANEKAILDKARKEQQILNAGNAEARAAQTHTQNQEIRNAQIAQSGAGKEQYISRINGAIKAKTDFTLQDGSKVINDGGTWVIEKGEKEISYDLSDAELMEYINGQFKPAPTKRLKSPFKRMAEFFTSPFKKDPEKVYGEAQEEAGEWEVQEDGSKKRIIKSTRDWNQAGQQKSFAEAGVDPEAAKAYWAANPEKYKEYLASKAGQDVSQREEFMPGPEKPAAIPPSPMAPKPVEPQYTGASLTRPSAKQADGTRGSHGASYEDFNNLSPKQMASLEKRAANATSSNEARNLKTPEMLAKDRGWDMAKLNPAQKKWLDKTVASKNKIYEANKVTLTKRK